MKKTQLNFEKEYCLKLQNSMIKEETALDDNLNGWIVIPSFKNDKANFKANVEKLKMLFHDNWCTKSFNAEPYLREGNFHVYMENGKPKLGVRFLGDKIEEFQGELNNCKIPVKYGDIAIDHIKDYKLTDNANRELKQLEKNKVKIDKIKSKLPNKVNDAPTQDILEALGITCKKDSNGLLIISHYGDRKLDYSYSDIGIDEDRLFKDIKIIEGDAYFSNSKVTNLGNVQTIGGDVNFCHSQITSLGNLQLIGGSAVFSNSKITSLGNLQTIGRTADIRDSKLKPSDFASINIKGNLLCDTALQSLYYGIIYPTIFKLRKIFYIYK